MALTGNDVANAYWEARLPPGFVRPGGENIEGKPPPDLDAFVARKYAGRQWASSSSSSSDSGPAWPPRLTGSWEAAVEQHARETRRLEQRASGAAGGVGNLHGDDDEWGDFEAAPQAPPHPQQQPRQLFASLI